MGQTTKAAEEAANASILQRDQQLAELAGEIRKQIAELEAALAEAKTASDTEKVEIQKNLTATKDAHTRETARVNLEIERLGRLQTLLQ